MCCGESRQRAERRAAPKPARIPLRGIVRCTHRTRGRHLREGANSASPHIVDPRLRGDDGMCCGESRPAKAKRPGRSQAGPHPLGGSCGVPTARGVVTSAKGRIRHRRTSWIPACAGDDGMCCGESRAGRAPGRSRSRPASPRGIDRCAHRGPSAGPLPSRPASPRGRPRGKCQSRQRAERRAAPKPARIPSGDRRCTRSARGRHPRGPSAGPLPSRPAPPRGIDRHAVAANGAHPSGPSAGPLPSRPASPRGIDDVLAGRGVVTSSHPPAARPPRPRWRPRRPTPGC